MGRCAELSAGHLARGIRDPGELMGMIRVRIGEGEQVVAERA